MTAVPMISMDKGEARKAFLAYRDAVRKRASKEDEALTRGYRALAKGQKIIELSQTFKAAGVDDRFRPRLAIARASWAEVWFIGSEMEFRRSRCVPGNCRRGWIRLPENALPNSVRAAPASRAVLPLISPQYRPDGSLEGYHILWEPAWEEPPRDPILLKHLAGWLYAVLAVWDLTELERAVLRGRL